MSVYEITICYDLLSSWATSPLILKINHSISEKGIQLLKSKIQIQWYTAMQYRQYNMAWLIQKNNSESITVLTG